MKKSLLEMALRGTRYDSNEDKSDLSNYEPNNQTRDNSKTNYKTIRNAVISGLTGLTMLATGCVTPYMSTSYDSENGGIEGKVGIVTAEKGAWAHIKRNKWKYIGGLAVVAIAGVAAGSGGGSSSSSSTQTTEEPVTTTNTKPKPKPEPTYTEPVSQDTSTSTDSGGDSGPSAPSEGGGGGSVGL